jgi:hypothetical protein
VTQSACFFPPLVKEVAQRDNCPEAPEDLMALKLQFNKIYIKSLPVFATLRRYSLYEREKTAHISKSRTLPS